MKYEDIDKAASLKDEYDLLKDIEDDMKNCESTPMYVAININSTRFRLTERVSEKLADMIKDEMKNIMKQIEEL